MHSLILFYCFNMHMQSIAYWISIISWVRPDDYNIHMQSIPYWLSIISCVTQLTSASIQGKTWWIRGLLSRYIRSYAMHSLILFFYFNIHISLPPEEESVLYPQRRHLFSIPRGWICSLPHEEDFVFYPSTSRFLQLPFFWFFVYWRPGHGGMGENWICG